MSKSKSQVTGAHSLNPAGKRKRNWRLPGYYGWIPFECSGEAYYCYAYASIKPQQRSNSKTGCYNGYTSSRPQQTSSKRGYYKEEGRSNSKDGKDKEGEKKNKDTDKDKLKNEEFPSLNVKVDQKDTNGSKQVNGKGVWENPPLWKGKEDLKTGPSSIRCRCGVHSYTKLVPKKPSLNEKIDQKDTNGSKQVNGKGVWENPPLWKGKEDLKTGPSSIRCRCGVHSYTKLVPKKPSLNEKIDQKDTNGSKQVNGKGVWENPPLWKGKEDLKTGPSSIRCRCGVHSYTKLVPKKPSLNEKIDQKDTNGSKQVNGKGVWENPPLWKGKEDLKTGPSSIRCRCGVHSYTKLVPKKPSLNEKIDQKDTNGSKQVNGKGVWENPPLWKGKEDLKTGPSSIRCRCGVHSYTKLVPKKPSLNEKIDQKDTNGSKQVNGKGVWENPPLWKGKEDLKTGPSSIRCRCGVHSYTKLVPKKPSLNEKIDQKDTNGSKQVNGKGVWENPPLWKGKEDLKTGPSSIRCRCGVHSYTKLVPKKPSLNEKIDQKDTNGSKQVNGKGVWENPPLWKGKEDLKTGPSSIRCRCGVHSYTKLVPKKPSLNEKIDQKDTNGSKQVNGKGVWENPPMRKCKEDLKTGHSSIKSNGGVHSYTKLVPKKSTPKTLGDKKSQFLKTLRTENVSNQKDGEKTPPKKQDKAQENKPGESLLVNGIDNLEIERANDSSLLSISLEAEQRLLRLMGWNEADEEEYEITEDDIKEFQNRSKQVQQQRNGLVRTLPKIWSPAYFSVVGRYPETQ